MTRSRIESDREDLLAEAVNLPERVELVVPGHLDPVIVGCHIQGQWSFYFGANMIRLDAEGQLRRAFHDGRLYRTQGTTLCELTRTRTETETELQRRDLKPGELTEVLTLFGTWLGQLRTTLREGTCRWERQVGTGPEFESRLTGILDRVQLGLTLAPPFATKRT